jgi:integrase
VDVRPYGRIYELRLGPSESVPFRGPDGEALANAVLESIRNRIADGLSKPAAVGPFLTRASTSVGSLLARWIDDLEALIEAGDRSPSYVRKLRGYSRLGGHFDALRELSVWEIATKTISAWNRDLGRAGLSAKSRKNVIGAFHAFMSWLVEQGELETVPRFPKIPSTEYAPSIITPADQELVLAAIPQTARGAFLVAVEEVARPGEIRALNVADYSWRDRILTIRAAMQGEGAHPRLRAPRTKERDVRRREVSDRLADWLEVHVPLEDRLQGDLSLFRCPGARTHAGRWTGKAMRAAWNDAAAAVGLKGVALYEGTKHSTLTALANAGERREVLAALAGHARLESTERYAKLATATITRAARLRDELT